MHGMTPRAAGSTLLGRHRELAALRAWLDRTVAGRGRLVLLAGEAGIGKTRLAQEVGMLTGGPGGAGVPAVVWGHCVDTDGAPRSGRGDRCSGVGHRGPPGAGCRIAAGPVPCTPSFRPSTTSWLRRITW